MPTYEYKCDACGHEFEKFQSITSQPIKKCPQCGKNKVRRLISSGAGLIFKGGGFYITDYRDASYKEKAKADSGAATTDAKPAAASEGKGESRPAEAAPAASKDAPAGGAASSTKTAPAAASAESKTPKSAKSDRKGKS